MLIDELGAHLHPRWRMRIVPSLRQVFPRVQFLTSTHDPLCLRGLGDGEVVVVKRDPDGEVVAVTDLPSVAGLRVDQLLTSEHFGLNSTIDPELDSLFAEYYLLKAKPHRTAADTRRLGELAEAARRPRRARLDARASGSCSRRPTTTSRRPAALADPGERLAAEGVDEEADRGDLGEGERGEGGPVIRVKLPTAARGPPRQGRGRARRRRARISATPRSRASRSRFGVYKLTPVKDALNATFHFKCAYCESYFGATQPLDVEHFRPKSGVLVGDELVWGVYYWLAASWGNLLPSCTDCNRPRRQALPDGSEQTLGKANQFPISSEAKRAATEGRGEGGGAAARAPLPRRPRAST